jgi:GT2 family glycosyltransferase
VKDYTIIIPNRFEEVIQPLLRTLKTYEDKVSIVVIADNHDRSYGYQMIKTTGNFVFSRAINLGIELTFPNDIIILNDDVRLVQPNTFETLQSMAYSDQDIGILSPLVNGGCGNVYMKESRNDLWNKNFSGIHYCSGLRGPHRVTFACVYIKRLLIDEIGHMDEQFVGYGFDDADYCIRSIKAGWKIAITNRATVQHGDGGSVFERGKNWNTSFMKNRVGGTRRNLTYLMTKHFDIFKDNSKIEQTNG